MEATNAIPPPEAYLFGDDLAEQKSTATFGLSWYKSDAAREARSILDSCVDGAGFFRGYDRDNMGWPVVMAAAATIVEQAGGAIATDGYGWFAPAGNEVRQILSPEETA